MRYLIFFIVIVIVGLIVYVLFKNQKDNQQLPLENVVDTLPEEQIIVNYLASNSINDNNLVEIKDHNVLATLDNLTVNGGKALKEIKDSTKMLCEVIVPKGAKLVKSKDKTVKNAVRGFYRGSKNIKGQANLVEAGKAANVVSSTMSIASAIVGQYYMAEISNEIKSLDNKLDKVSNFQNDEYKGNLMTIMSEVNEILKYKDEIIQKHFLRQLKLDNLENLGKECTSLLNQSSLAIERIINDRNISYEEYENKIKELNDWYMYQGYLFDILEQIDNLKYVLNMGEVSREMCFEQYNKQKPIVQKTQQSLVRWHDDMFGKLQIDINSERIRKSGIAKYLLYLPGLINDNLNFNQLPSNIVDMIRAQSKEEIKQKKEMLDLYGNELKIIYKGDKCYFYKNNKK